MQRTRHFEEDIAEVEAFAVETFGRNHGLARAEPVAARPAPPRRALAAARRPAGGRSARASRTARAARRSSASAKRGAARRAGSTSTATRKQNATKPNAPRRKPRRKRVGVHGPLEHEHERGEHRVRDGERREHARQRRPEPGRRAGQAEHEQRRRDRARRQVPGGQLRRSAASPIVRVGGQQPRRERERGQRRARARRRPGSTPAREGERDGEEREPAGSTARSQPRARGNLPCDCARDARGLPQARVVEAARDAAKTTTNEASATSPSSDAAAARAAKCAPCSSSVISRIGPATSGSATSRPETSWPQRRPASEEPTTSSGASVSLTSSSDTPAILPAARCGDTTCDRSWPSGARGDPGRLAHELADRPREGLRLVAHDQRVAVGDLARAARRAAARRSGGRARGAALCPRASTRRAPGARNARRRSHTSTICRRRPPVTYLRRSRRTRAGSAAAPASGRAARRAAGAWPSSRRRSAAGAARAAASRCIARKMPPGSECRSGARSCRAGRVGSSRRPRTRRSPGARRARASSPASTSAAAWSFCTSVTSSQVEARQQLARPCPRSRRSDRSASGCIGFAVRAERERRHDAAMLAAQVLDDRVPHRAVHHQAAEQHEHRARRRRCPRTRSFQRVSSISGICATPSSINE